METYCWMQSHYCKNKSKNQGHNNKEGVEPTIMSRWSKKMEEKSREGERPHIANKWNKKQSNKPVISKK